MNIDYFKTILFIAAAVFPVLLILNKSYSQYRKFLLTIFFLNLVLILIITFKLHHLLRTQFNIPNTVTYILGAIPFLILIVKHYSLLIAKESFLFVTSIFLLAIAVIIDLLSDGKFLNIPNNDFIEEIFRIGGALVWFVFNSVLYSRLKKI